MGGVGERDEEKWRQLYLANNLKKGNKRRKKDNKE